MPDETPTGPYASPPCFMHELHEGQTCLPADDPVQTRDVARWRKAERARLLAERAALGVVQRQDAARAIADFLDAAIGDVSGLTVSAFWPIKSEPDLRFWLGGLRARGAQAALPLVVEKNAPLRFRAWHPGVAMERGFWNIPVPAKGDWVTPDIAIAPLVGHDPAGFRLGYGGGYFDRTLAAHPGIRAIGIGLACARVATIFPQGHDVPMALIITELG